MRTAGDGGGEKTGSEGGRWGRREEGRGQVRIAAGVGGTWAGEVWGRRGRRARASAGAYPAPLSVYLGIEPNARAHINVAPAAPLGLCAHALSSQLAPHIPLPTRLLLPPAHMLSAVLPPTPKCHSYHLTPLPCPADPFTPSAHMPSAATAHPSPEHKPLAISFPPSPCPYAPLTRCCHRQLQPFLIAVAADADAAAAAAAACLSCDDCARQINTGVHKWCNPATCQL